MTTDHSLAQEMPDRETEIPVLMGLLEDALLHARQLGADQAEAQLSVNGGIDVNVRLGEVETIEHTRDRGIGVTLMRGRRRAHAASADLRPGAILACVERAFEMAAFTEEDACNGLADPERLATHFPDLDQWHPRQIHAEDAVARALAAEAAGRADPRISNSEGASASTDFGLSVYGNSHGFRGASSGTRFGQSCVLIAGEDEAMQRDYWYDSRRCLDDLESPEATGQRAAQRTVARLNARKIATCEAPVLLAPSVARSLLGNFLGAVSGGALYRNASFLKDALGQQLFPEWLSLVERPFIPRAVGSSAFDAEGVATTEQAIVKGGVLSRYVLSSYAARRLGLATTGNAGGVHNLCLEGVQPYADLLGGIRSGLLVTEVMGQGVNLLTGDYSRGATGFWVENGEPVFPVEEVTIAGNLREMFRNLQAAGDDVDLRGNVRGGSLLLARMTIAGQ